MLSLHFILDLSYLFTIPPLLQHKYLIMDEDETTKPSAVVARQVDVEDDTKWMPEENHKPEEGGGAFQLEQQQHAVSNSSSLRAFFEPDEEEPTIHPDISTSSSSLSVIVPAVRPKRVPKKLHSLSSENQAIIDRIERGIVDVHEVIGNSLEFLQERCLSSCDDGSRRMDFLDNYSLTLLLCKYKGIDLRSNFEVDPNYQEAQERYPSKQDKIRAILRNYDREEKRRRRQGSEYAGRNNYLDHEESSDSSDDIPHPFDGNPTFLNEEGTMEDDEDDSRDEDYQDDPRPTTLKTLDPQQHLQAAAMVTPLSKKNAASTRKRAPRSSKQSRSRRKKKKKVPRFNNGSVANKELLLQVKQGLLCIHDVIDNSLDFLMDPKQEFRAAFSVETMQEIYSMVTDGQAFQPSQDGYGTATSTKLELRDAILQKHHEATQDKKPAAKTHRAVDDDGSSIDSLPLAKKEKPKMDMKYFEESNTAMATKADLSFFSSGVGPRTTMILPKTPYQQFVSQKPQSATVDRLYAYKSSASTGLQNLELSVSFMKDIDKSISIEKPLHLLQKYITEAGCLMGEW